MIRLTTLIAVAATAMAVPALAQEARPASDAAPRAERVVMLCASDAATRSAFRREHGKAPVFVTAEQALHARATGESWSAPRCMNAREHARLSQTLSAYAAVR